MSVGHRHWYTSETEACTVLLAFITLTFGWNLAQIYRGFFIQSTQPLLWQSHHLATEESQIANKVHFDSGARSNLTSHLILVSWSRAPLWWSWKQAFMAVYLSTSYKTYMASVELISLSHWHVRNIIPGRSLPHTFFNHKMMFYFCR